MDIENLKRMLKEAKQLSTHELNMLYNAIKLEKSKRYAEVRAAKSELE